MNNQKSVTIRHIQTGRTHTVSWHIGMLYLKNFAQEYKVVTNKKSLRCMKGK